MELEIWFTVDPGGTLVQVHYLEPTLQEHVESCKRCGSEHECNRAAWVSPTCKGSSYLSPGTGIIHLDAKEMGLTPDKPIKKVIKF